MQTAATFRLAAIGVAAVFLSACHRSSTDSTPTSKVARGVLGDTAAFGADIVRFNATRTQATYRLTAPGHVILLALTPGEQIERIRVAATDASPMRVGQHTTYLPLKPDEFALGIQRAHDQAEYDRCVEAARAAADRRRPKPEKRDSTGRVISEGGGRQESPLEVQQRAERACTAQARGRASPQTSRRPRYLALIATDTPVAADQVDLWLNSLPAPTEDVPAALSAVADVLFRDRRGAWSAVYRRWW
jgi:hypothetical protein